MRSDDGFGRIGRLLIAVLGLVLSGGNLWAGDPAPTNPGGGWQGPFYLSPPYGGENALVANPAMPALSMYLATQNGSGLTLNSNGSFTYQWNGVSPRQTESQLYTDIYLEYQDSSGNWDPIPWNGGMPDLINGFGFGGEPSTAISGTNGQSNPSATVQWNSYEAAGGWNLPPNTSFRVFIYAYVWDQGQHPAFVNLASWSNIITTPGLPSVSWTSTPPGTVYSGTVLQWQAQAYSPSVPVGSIQLHFDVSTNGGAFQPNAYQWATDTISNPVTASGIGNSYTMRATVNDGTTGGYFVSPIYSTVTVVAAPAGASNATIPFGQSFTPSYYGGTGAGPWQFVISDYTNWDGGNDGNSGTNVPGIGWSNSWTPPAVGSYTFYVSQFDGVGSTATGYLGPYTLTVTEGTQSPVSSANATIPYGQPFTPQYFGGSGTGGWQFVVSGYTNWDGGNDSNSGTNVPGAGWESSWTPPSVGSYTFYVVHDENGNYSASNYAGPYTLTVTPLSASFSASPLSFTYNGSSQGPGISASPGGVTYGTSGTTSAVGEGTYSLTVFGTGNYTGSNSFTWTIGGANQSPVTIFPLNSTISAGQSVTFTASGGSGTGAYTWGGSASGTGQSQTLSFGSVGTFVVTVYRAGDGNYNPSNTASAEVTVNQLAQDVAISPASATVTAGNSVPFTATGGQEGYIWGGAASGGGSVNSVVFPSAGSFEVTVYSPAGGAYAQSNVAVASVTVMSPTYTLTVNAGPGGTATGSASGLAGNATPAISAIPSSGYAFVDWTGDLTANPNAASTTIAMNNANRTVTANFTALQAQTITFNPPATALYPGPAIVLTATASSGLPVSFSVLSGPATLSGSTLTFTGQGTVTVQASQGGGSNGGVYYQAAPTVGRSIQVNAPFTIIRLRFNSPGIVNGVSTGNTTIDAQGVGHSAAGKGQTSFIWTDPTGLQNSPWPTFNNPVSVSPAGGLFSLPSPPVVAPTQANSVPTGQLTGSP